MRLFRRKAGPPDAGAVMARLLVIKAQIETWLAAPPPDVLSDLMRAWAPSEREAFIAEYRRLAGDLEPALKDGGLWDAMTPGERAFIRAVPPEVSHRTYVDVSWLMESADCLLWSLGLIDRLPAYDTQADVEHLARVPADSARVLVSSARLRPMEAISRARDIAELWHWRARTRQLQESGEPVRLPEGMTLTRIVQITAEQAASDGLFDAPLGNDFPAFGRPYRDLSPDEWSQAMSIAVERHRAFNWICGYAPGNRWDETPTDT